MKYRTFTLDDQTAFAKLSGDYNPLHIDPLAARRTLFGSPAVHGIHAVLWCLDSWLADNPSNIYILSVRAVFPRPIRVGEEVSLLYEIEDEGRLRIELDSSTAMSTIVHLQWDKSDPKEHDYTKDRFPEKREPRALSGEEIEGQVGTVDLCLHNESLAKMFPNLARFVSPMQIAAILCTTRVVGVECPGRHSMYTEFNLASGEFGDLKEMQYKVTKFDRRFGLAFISIAVPGMSGTVKAFVRPPEHNQDSFIKLKGLVKESEFERQRAIVIGGSRGLGEVVAKLLAAGAAEVRLTYHQGEKDAHGVVNEINSSGGDAASLQLNVLNPDGRSIEKSLGGWKPTHLYYFATPFIFVGSKGIFSTDLFSKFCDYYIKGFLNTVNYFRDLGLKNIYCPSTVAIDELPADMGEYAAAKTAAETVCSFLEKNNKDMTIHRPRLPRMSTDQTVSLLPVKNNDPVPIMLEHLRNLRDASARKG